MLERRYAARGAPLPEGGLELRLDWARFRLDTGELWAMEPVAGGRVTGALVLYMLREMLRGEGGDDPARVRGEARRPEFGSRGAGARGAALKP